MRFIQRLLNASTSPGGAFRWPGFLFTTVMVLGLALSDDTAAGTVYPMPSPPLENPHRWAEDNRGTIAAARNAFKESLRGNAVSIIRPEYERRLGEMVFAVRRQANMRRPLADFGDLFAALPPYTRLHLFVPEAAAEGAEDQLEDLGLEERTTIHTVESEFLSGRWKSWADITVSNSNLWMRDIVLVGSVNGAPRIYQPLAYNATSDLRHNDTDFIRKLGGAGRQITVVPFPHFIRGGNLLVGEAAGRLVAFVGAHEVDFNAAALPVLTQDSPSPAVVAERFLDDLKRVTGADRVVVLPNTPLVFHLDQALIFLGPGRVGVLKSIDGLRFGAAEEKMFSEIRQALTDTGFSIVDIPSSPGHLGRYESSANAVLFRNAHNDVPTALVPRFPDAEVTWEGRQYSSLMDLVAQVYRREGYAVVFVKDAFHAHKGNLHCVTLPLN